MAFAVSLFTAIGQIFGPKENIENFKLNNDDIKGFESERNSNLVEIKFGAGATVMAIIGMMLLLGMCALGAKGLIRCFKKSTVMKCINKTNKKNIIIVVYFNEVKMLVWQDVFSTMFQHFCIKR